MSPQMPLSDDALFDQFAPFDDAREGQWREIKRGEAAIGDELSHSPAGRRRMLDAMAAEASGEDQV